MFFSCTSLFFQTKQWLQVNLWHTGHYFLLRLFYCMVCLSNFGLSAFIIWCFFYCTEQLDACWINKVSIYLSIQLSFPTLFSCFGSVVKSLLHPEALTLDSCVWSHPVLHFSSCSFPLHRRRTPCPSWPSPSSAILRSYPSTASWKSECRPLQSSF